MTTKRSKRQRRQKLLVAPGREPDVIDAMLVRMREEMVRWKGPTIHCRRCGKDQAPNAFKFGERTKPEPTCLACAAAWHPQASDALRAIDVAEKPKRPLAPFVAYRLGIAELIRWEIDEADFQAYWARMEKDAANENEPLTHKKKNVSALPR